MDTYSKIEKLMTDRNISAYRLSKDTGISTGLLSQWKKRMQNPSVEKLQIIADYFHVSVDYLIGNEPKETPVLTEKDERDISKRLDRTLADLENAQGGLMFDGEPLDDLTKELLIASLKKDLEISKKIAKQKYTPKKYRTKSGG